MTSSPVTIPFSSLLKPSSETSKKISSAFSTSPTSQGLILISDLPSEFSFPGLRKRLLGLSNSFAELDDEDREKCADESSKYSFGWSLGKEIMNGKPDTLKGSYYNNVLASVSSASSIDAVKTAPPALDDERNIWPSEKDHKTVNGYKEAFLELCGLMLFVGGLVARACDKVTSDAGGLANSKSVEKLILESKNSKARLLHYFPPDNQVFRLPAADEVTESAKPPDDSWCGTHIDHSILTALCPAMYLFHPEPTSSGTKLDPLIIPSPSESAGLFIQTRAGETVRAPIPEDCLAFQTGETLSLLSSLKLAATPHFVNANPTSDVLSPKATAVVRRKIAEDPAWKDVETGRVSRETLAVFLQPNGEEVVGADGETFAQFTDRVLKRHYSEKEEM
ncbi:Clavaminate synthase-like protein [Meredithblackwellia eburnea MCA 4105]